MGNDINKDDPRTFLYLRDLKRKLAEYATSDPRFDSLSACCKHLLKLGLKADQKDREKALKEIT